MNLMINQESSKRSLIIKDDFYSNSLLENSLEFKLLYLQKLAKEIEARKKYLYYTYRPADKDNAPIYNETHQTKKYAEVHRCLADGVRLIALDGGARAAKTTTILQLAIKLALGECEFCDFQTPMFWWIIVSDFKKVYETGGMIDKIIGGQNLNYSNYSN